MNWRKFEEYKQSAFTFSGLIGLNLPCLVSRMSPESNFGSLQRLGMVFNLDRRVLDEHFSFSPKNIEEGRYHTCITNIFHHAGVEHFYGNMSVLIASGLEIHRRYGRRHLLTAFIGGGIAGNAAQFSQYLYQQIQWGNILPSPNTWIFFGGSFTNRLESWQKLALGKVYSSVNSWRPCIGASAALSALVAIDTCFHVVSLIEKFNEVQRRRRNGIHDPDWNYWAYLEAMYHLSHLCMTAMIVYEDTMLLIDSTRSGQGVIRSLVAYSVDGIGHAAHIGGFLFGLIYYVFVLLNTSRRPRSASSN